MPRPVAVDLFAGVGGMSLGFEQAGFDVVCAVETDPAHAAAHRFNFPLCEVVQIDARSLTEERLREGVQRGLKRHGRRPTAEVDVVFGGPPCQGFSVGGIGDPNDPRNRLVEEFARLVAALRPKAWVLENVPAMASRSLPGDDTSSVLEWLASRMGREAYNIAATGVLNANRYGIPQDRRRLLIVGTRDEASVTLPRPKSAGLPRVPGRSARPGEYGHGDTPDHLARCPTVKEALGDLPDIGLYAGLWTSDSIALDPKDREDMRLSGSTYARTLTGTWRDPQDLSWPRRQSPARLTASMRTAHSEAVVQRFHETAHGEREAISRFLRLHPDGVAPTLRAGTAPDRGSYSAPRPIHYAYDRVITVREAARLHGFPDWFRPTAAKWHGFRQVGNAVPPPLARAVAEAIRPVLGCETIRPDRRLSLGEAQLLRVANGGGRSAAKRLLEKNSDEGASELQAA
jgi:DNA (cytosine-5)-methyltransferase 1